jgi:glycosyltransferase involved in cell wall biosynthesis
VNQAEPVVSVVVPTYNRAELLEPLAAALAAQQGVGPYEVLFVDDGSGDATPSVLDAIVKRVGRPAEVSFRVLRSEHNTGNPARTRNLGWRDARAPIVAFIDDDCMPSPHWLIELVTGLEGADLVQGLVEVDQDEALKMGPFGRILVITDFSWKFETCNIAYRRELLEAVGGFEEAFPVPFGEDTDLGLRAVEHGARAAWAPEAVVLHRVECSESRLRDWLGSFRYARRCEFAALLVRRHPGFRRHLFARCFYKSYHAYTLGVLAGTGALVRGRPVAAATLAAPWLYYRLRVERPTARSRWMWAVLPMALAVDAVELGSTLKGAFRFRTLLL